MNGLGLMRRAPAWRRPDGSRRPGHHEAEAVACPRRTRRQLGRPTWQGKPSWPEAPANWPEHSDIPARSSFAYPAFSPVIPPPAVTDLPNRQGPCLRKPSGRIFRTSHKCRFRLTHRISPQTRHISLYGHSAGRLAALPGVPVCRHRQQAAVGPPGARPCFGTAGQHRRLDVGHAVRVS
jgi:hypothetical protein